MEASEGRYISLEASLEQDGSFNEFALIWPNLAFGAIELLDAEEVKWGNGVKQSSGTK